MNETLKIGRRALCLALAAPAALGRSAEPAPAAVAVPAPRLEFAYEALVLLAPDVPFGRTPYGERTRAPIIGGTFQGPALRGRVLPGGEDWQLRRADGYLELTADYHMETADGTPIHVHNRGLWHSATGDWPADYAITTPEFEVPLGPYDWLNRHVFLGTVGPGPDERPAVIIRVFRAS